MDAGAVAIADNDAPLSAARPVTEPQTEPTAAEARQTRQHITPDAFQVHPALLGQALARPSWRLLAIALDGLLVALLTAVPPGLLVIVAGVLTFRWTGQQRHKTPSPMLTLLRGAAAVAALLAAVATLFGAIDRGPAPLERLTQPSGTPLRAAGEVGKATLGTAKLAALALDIETGRCADVDCARPALMEFATVIGRGEATDAEAAEVVDEMTAKLPVSAAARNGLRADFLARVEQVRAAQDEQRAAREEAADEAPESLEYSLLGWARGILRDLGLGLGWAAVYFSAFVALWHGQTPGKKLFGLRVVRLNGEPMSLWDAFGRYGGYSAGFATGLLGFLQVYWDDNRQAIQDKIAGTVVIRGELPRGIAQALPAQQD